MKSRLTPARRKEYDELKSFFELWETAVRRRDERLDPRHHPLEVLKQIEAKYGYSMALKGLKQAIGDILEQTSDLRPEAVREIDAALSREGYVTLSTLRMRYRATYQAILKRGRIRSSTEFYLLSGIASDMSLELPSQEREAISRLLAAYEFPAIPRRISRSHAKKSRSD